MAGGTLLVSRFTNLFPQFKTQLEALGFPDVHVTDTEKDGLNMLINELKPEYFLIGSNFYDCGTPYMMGQLLSVFPTLNIAVVTTSPFSDNIATWFMFHGIKTYVKLSDGVNEFQHALHCYLDGKEYVAPAVQNILDALPIWPTVSLKETKRQKEVLLMLCNGFKIKSIEDDLQIGKVTVEYHIRELMKVFNCQGREELIKIAHCLEIFTKEDLCFNDTKQNKIKLPDWAVTQQYINKRNRGLL
ncbi:MAG: LuxR C-terminal-related transcriptional regulator [Treponema sp.]|nr:LuxR C-terminal-related transcriptional regulator [Treponema sp.]